MSAAESSAQPLGPVHTWHEVVGQAYYLAEGDDVWEILDEVAALSRGRGARVEVVHERGRVTLLMGDGVILAETPPGGLDDVRGWVRVEALLAPLRILAET